MDFQAAIEQLQQEKDRLESKRLALVEKSKLVAVEAERLDALFQKSGYATPRALINALIMRYRVQPSISDPEMGRRRHIRVTETLRDLVKSDISSGMTMAKAARHHRLSYAVVSRIAKGHYDDLSSKPKLGRRPSIVKA
jgi:hypothetical protein